MLRLPIIYAIDKVSTKNMILDSSWLAPVQVANTISGECLSFLVIRSVVATPPLGLSLGGSREKSGRAGTLFFYTLIYIMRFKCFKGGIIVKIEDRSNYINAYLALLTTSSGSESHLFKLLRCCLSFLVIRSVVATPPLCLSLGGSREKSGRAGTLLCGRRHCSGS